MQVYYFKSEAVQKHHLALNSSLAKVKGKLIILVG